MATNGEGKFFHTRPAAGHDEGDGIVTELENADSEYPPAWVNNPGAAYFWNLWERGEIEIDQLEQILIERGWHPYKTKEQ